MKYSAKRIIYTIGHSTHSLDEFIQMLQSFLIKSVVDIRRFPGSKKFPQFNQKNLEINLTELGIKYLHLEGLGGRRKDNGNSENSRWRNASFRGYSTYMETDDFKTAISQLIDIASQNITVYMCSEAVWWRCHRAMVSDYLKAKGWEVRHIMAIGKFEEHPYTSAAKVVDGKVSYSENDNHN